MKRIAIIGDGYVGKAMVELMKDHYEIILKGESLSEKIFSPNNKEVKVFERTEDGYVGVNTADLAIICVPTQQNDDGSCDTSIVESVIEKLETPLILIKSTIAVGTVDRLKEKYKKRICFSPEYIGEGNYFVQYWKGHPHPTMMLYHDFMIAGGDKKDTSAIIDFFTPIMGASKTYAQTDARTAETVKYMENVWGAMKVTFFNEMYECCKALGVDYNEARELFALDGRVEKMHSLVFPNKRGFGGKCFPKDLAAFIHSVTESGYNPKLLNEIVNLNKIFNKMNETDD